MNLLQEWVALVVSLSREPEDLTAGARKILRNRVITFKSWDNSLQLSHAGYTKSKMSMLTRNYLHQESQAMTMQLWDRRREQQKYGSVSFTTFNHYVKGKGTLKEIVARKSRIAGVFGPCIQSVSITWLTKTTAAVDVFYRNTEIAKKFPADIVFIRDVLLAPFNFSGMSYVVSFHFANVTVHPQYCITIIPHLSDPVRWLEGLKKIDPPFYQRCLRWNARYLLPEHTFRIENFSQAMRVKMDADRRISTAAKKELRTYLRKNYRPGRGATVEEEELT